MCFARIFRLQPGTRSDLLSPLGALLAAALIASTTLAASSANADMRGIPMDSSVSPGDAQLFSFAFGGGFGNRGMLSSSVVNLTWSHVGGPAGMGPVLDPIFTQSSWTPGDAGRIVIVNSGNDPNFNAFASLLTDGRPEDLVLFFAAGATPTLMDGAGFNEAAVVFGSRIDPRVDLHGYQIDSLSVEMVSMSIHNPPDGSGSYMVDFNIIFSGSGHPVPEPAAAALMLSSLCRARRRSVS